MVRTSAQTRQEELKETQQVTRKKVSDVWPKLWDDRTGGDAVVEAEEVIDEREAGEAELPGSIFAEELFRENRQRKPKQTRKQKRLEWSKHGLVRGKDRAKEKQQTESLEVSVGSEDLRHLQQEDKTLASVLEAAEGKTELVESKFFTGERCQ